MLYKKTGFPEESEITMCTVTKVQHHSVFVKLDEYGYDGLVHISEVSPGRIRNIRDFVKEGKKIVCKVLRVNQQRGHIDLSLRRVSDGQRRTKVDEIKQEQKAEKIVEYVAKQLKIDFKKLYEELMKAIFEDYDQLHLLFIDIIHDEADLSDYKLDKKTEQELTKTIKQRLKPISVSIKGTLELSSTASDGVEVIKKSLKKGLIGEGIVLKYIGAGKYGITITAPDYKKAEKLLENSSQAILKEIEGKGEGEFFRKK